MNQNSREELPDTKLIPYLGLHKQDSKTWKVCNRKRNANERKDLPVQNKNSVEDATTSGLSELVKSKLE